MAKLILVRHANTQPSADAPDHDWPLTEEGQQRAALVAQALKQFEVGIIYSSTMGRAIKTGEAISAELALPHPVQNAAFNENDRSGMPFIKSRDAFVERIKQFLEQPDEVVMGSESAEMTLTRFRHAVDSIRRTHPSGDIVIVSHGTVMALFLAHRSGQPAIEMWHGLQTLGMPNYVVLDMDTLQILEKHAV